MARSLRNGDYRLLLAVQSPRDPERWYRVLADNATGALSCDCPAWTFNQRGNRACKHTEFVSSLVRGQQTATSVPRMRVDHPLIGATRTQWAPLRQFVAEDAWGLQEGRGQIGGEPFDLVLVEASGATGTVATGTVAFARAHQWPIGQRAAAVAGWCGYAIAADFARQAGAAFVGEPPAHWRGEAPTRRRGAVAPASGDAAILQVGNRPDLDDGLTPTERAERTLRLFLGAERLLLLQRQGFLDIASALHDGRVYRLRRDPQHRRERRIRVFEGGRYVRDLCVVRAQNVPEADHYLTVYFGLLANEAWVLSVVRGGNIFSPNSDGPERETLPTIWTPRAAPVAA